MMEDPQMGSAELFLEEYLRTTGFTQSLRDLIEGEANIS
jgi:hypothetical protein